MKHTPDCEQNQPGWNYKSLIINPKMELKYLRSDNEKNNYYDDPIVIKRYSSNLKGVLAQLMVAAAVFMLIAGSRTTIKYYDYREHWILLVHWLATAIGALVSGPLMDYIGRRGCLQFASLSLCLGWIVAGSSKYYIAQKCLGSILLGFAAGLIDAPTKVILAEMSDPRLRGILLGGTGVAYLAGNPLFSYLTDGVPWDSRAFYTKIPSILGFVALYWVHESPSWLIRQKKTEAATEALLWLRGGDKAQVNSEVDILEARANSDLPWKFNPAVMKPMILIIVFIVLYNLSGAYTFISVSLICVFDGPFYNNFTYLNIGSILCAWVLLLMVGRRTLGLLSGLGTGFISLILACLLFFGEEIVHYSIFITACFLIYVTVSTVGFMFLHGIMVGELLPQTARGLGSGFIYFLLHIIDSAVGYFQPELSFCVERSFGKPGSLLTFGIFGLINCIFIYFFLPETKDQTLQEIEDYFQEENIVWMNRKKERIQAEPLI